MLNKTLIRRDLVVQQLADLYVELSRCDEEMEIGIRLRIGENGEGTIETERLCDGAMFCLDVPYDPYCVNLDVVRTPCKFKFDHDAAVSAAIEHIENAECTSISIDPPYNFHDLPAAEQLCFMSWHEKRFNSFWFNRASSSNCIFPQKSDRHCLSQSEVERYRIDPELLHYANSDEVARYGVYDDRRGCVVWPF